MARVACISLPLLPLQVLLHENPNWRELPAAVIREDKPTSPLLFVNRAAHGEGVRAGMRYGDALALVPGLRAAPVVPDTLAAARADILRVISRFTPEIEPCSFDPESFWLNAAGLTALYRTLPEWIAALKAALAREGYRSSVVVGFTRFGSYVLARLRRKSGVVPSARAERDLVHRSPAAALPLAPRTKELLRRLKIASVHDFLSLPRDAVRKRFGEEARTLFDFATSSGLLPLQPLRFEEPHVYARSFDSPIASIELLMPEIEALLDASLARAAKAGRLLAGLTVALRTEEGEERSETIRAAQPTGDRRLLLRLIRLRLSCLLASEPNAGTTLAGSRSRQRPRADLRGGIVFLELRPAETPAAGRQHELIEESGRRDLAAGARAFALLRARFGNETVARASLRDSHVPERRFALEPLDRPALPRAGGIVGSPARPFPAVRRVFLSPAAALAPSAEQILTHDPVLLQDAWWSDHPVDREYLFVTRDGETHWLAYDRLARRWLLHGVVDGVDERASPVPLEAERRHEARQPAQLRPAAARSSRPQPEARRSAATRPARSQAAGRQERFPSRADAPAYVPLWCKSSFSFLEGASHPEELVEQAAALGLPALALTDRDGVYGIVKGYARMRALAGSDPAACAHGAGGTTVDALFGESGGAAAGAPGARAAGAYPRLIVGAELTVDPGGAEGAARATFARAAGTSRPPRGPRLLLLAADHTGYQNLCSLISAGRLRSPKGQSSVTVEEACARAKGLIALWTGGEETLPALADAFRGRLYAIVARHRWFGDPERERTARRAAARFDLPLVAANEVLYHDRSRKPLQDLLTCIRHGVTLEGAGTLLAPNAEHDLKSTADFARLYRDDPALVARTLEIAERCTFSLSEIEYRYPEEAAPAGLTTPQWLRSLTYEGARSRYGGEVPPEVAAQLERELAVIEELRYCGYFLTMWEIVQYCRRNGILCQGRGSAANSAVCYCLGITAIDPVRMDLLFERFLSHERAEPPDIDLDIEHNRREEVIQHMYRTYGRDRAAMVANVIRYRYRSAVREVGKALGVPAASLDRCARLLPHWEGDGLAQAVKEAGLDPDLPAHRHLLELTQAIVGFPRHLSIHPGGFLLGSEPVNRIVPIENATMPGRTVIQWDKEDVETLGLFKVDLLGLGALTHLDYSFRLLAKHYGVDLSMATIPAKDDETFAMIQRADTIGIFQIESRAQMAMLPRLLPACYYDLVIEVSLVRPGPITGGMVHPYLRRRQKKEEVVYPHPRLEPVLKKTLGVPLFQEQVMKLAVVAAGYTPGEADQLRRDMAAWRLAGKIEKHRTRLISGMRANGISEEFAEGVFQQIRGFGEYGFPESHAASFALIAYATAWMKCHYPAVFFCALLNAWPMGFYLPSTIVEDAKRHGVRVLPVDALTSDWDCTLEPAAPGVSSDTRASADRRNTPAFRATAEPRAPAHVPAFAVRMGLRYVKGLSKGDWERIAAARGSSAAHAALEGAAPAGASPAAGHGPVLGARDGAEQGAAACVARPRSIADFAAASGLARDTLEQLAESGALAGFGIHRRQALWEVLGAAAPPARATPGVRGPASDIAIPHGPPLADFPEEPAALAAPTHAEEITWDLATSGHSARGHVVELFRAQLAAEGLPDSAAVNRLPDKTPVSFAGYVICRQMPGNAKGVVFMTVEDEAGVVNVVAWKKVFARYRTLILTSWFLGVTGRLQSSDGVVHLVAESFWRPQIEGCGSDRSLALDSHDFY